MKITSMFFVGLFSLVSATGRSSIKSEQSQLLGTQTELGRKTITNKEGQAVTLMRVSNPALKKISDRVVTVCPKDNLVRFSDKTYALLSLNVVVYYDGATVITNIRWRSQPDGAEHQAWSNVDFSYLTQVAHIETEEVIFSCFTLVERRDLSKLGDSERSPVPLVLSLSKTEPEYIVHAGGRYLGDQELILTGIDYLHAYYKIHSSELKAEYENRQNEKYIREKELVKNPSANSEIVLQWWPHDFGSNSR